MQAATTPVIPAEPAKLQERHQPPPPEVKRQSPPRVTSKYKGLDLIAQADLAERRAREKEEARLRLGYPLAALAKERQAVADLRVALTKAVCAVLELCQQQQQQPEPPTSAKDGDESPLTGGFQKGGTWREGNPGPNATRGPPSTLVQMVCSGEDANVRCATSEYRLRTGTAAASRCSTAVSFNSSNCNAITESRSTADNRGLEPPHPTAQQSPPEKVGPSPSRSRLQGIAQTVAESGTMARTITSGLMPTSVKAETPGVLAAGSLTNPREALSAARAAVADVRSFSNDIKVDVGKTDQGPPSDTTGGGGGDTAGDACWKAQTLGPAKVPTCRENHAETEEVDTTASTRIVNALRGDISWAKSLPEYIRKAMEAQQGQFGEQVALK